MKAFILAAGLGTRLRTMGLDVPKVMVPICGKPLLEHHLELFRAQGIGELIINLHHLPDKITAYFGDGRRFGMKIYYSHEPDLLGTAGGVKKMEEALRDGTFIVFYGDNLVWLDFTPLIEFHRAHAAVATITLLESSEPWTGGMVETDLDGRVLRFVEKPKPEDVTSHLISAGIFLMEPRVLDEIPGNRFCDFGRDVFPELLAAGKRVYAMKPKGYIQDIGTPERVAKAHRDFEQGFVRGDHG